MDETAPNSIITKQHKQLLRIAFIADTVAWIVLVVTLLLFGYQIVEAVKEFVSLTVTMGYLGSFQFLFEQPVQAIRPFINVFYFLLRGVTYFLVLRGVSLGLNMIVETDINYIERSSEAENGG